MWNELHRQDGKGVDGHLSMFDNFGQTRETFEELTRWGQFRCQSLGHKCENGRSENGPGCRATDKA